MAVIRNLVVKIAADISGLSISKVFTKIWDIIIKVIDGILKSITVFLGYVKPIWEQVKALFASLWNVILKLWELLKPVFIALGVAVAAFYGTMIGTINGIIQALGPFILICPPKIVPV